MSQVIITNDSLREKREASRLAEKRINRDVITKSWMMPTLPKRDPIAMIAGVLAIPIAAFWAVMIAFLSLMMGAVLWLFRGLAKIIGRT